MPSSAAGSSTPTHVPERPAVQRQLRRRRRDRDTGPNRPNVIGDIKIRRAGRDQWFNATPIGSPNSAFARPAVGTFGNMERNALRGPGYWRTDASIFKHFRLGGNRDSRSALEAVNLFNNVNLGNPDSGSACPATRTNAGRINSTAFGNADPQRNFQFGLKFSF